MLPSPGTGERVPGWKIAVVMNNLTGIVVVGFRDEDVPDVSTGRTGRLRKPVGPSKVLPTRAHSGCYT